MEAHQAQISLLLAQRTDSHVRHDELLAEWDALVARRAEVLAKRHELHLQIRNKNPSQSVIERAQLRVQAHHLGEEVVEIDAKNRENQEREKVMIQEHEELEVKIEEAYEQLERLRRCRSR